MTFLLRASGGLLLWAASFSLLYALQGLSCALRWGQIPMPPGTVSSWVLIMTWSIFILIASLWIHKASRLAVGIERQLALSSAIIGLVAIVITGSPVLTNAPCA